MKKIISSAMVLLILLTACQTVPVVESGTASSTPASSGIVPPSSSVVPATSAPVTAPPATSTPPATTTPETTPPEPDETGYSFIYDGNAPFIGIDPDCSDCTVGHLYWVDKTTEEVTAILEEATLESIQEGAYVYYVKTAEPTKIYRTLIGAFSQHELIHETAHGKVGDMTIYPGIENYLQFVADNKKFVVFEFDIGIETVLMEQYYIGIAYITGENGVLGNWIWFEGKHKETDNSPYNQYFYYRDTGKTEVDETL